VLGNEQWQNRYNHEIYNLYMEVELTNTSTLRRLQWLGHVMSIKDERVLKTAFKYMEGADQLEGPEKDG
jgi:hypothetical protein